MEPYFYIMYKGKEIGAAYPMERLGSNLYTCDCAVILHPEEGQALPPFLEIREVDRTDGTLINLYNGGFLVSFKSISTCDQMFSVRNFVIIRDPVFYFEEKK